MTRPVVTRSFTKSVLALSILALTIAGAVFWNPFAAPIESTRPIESAGPKDTVAAIASAGSIVRATGPVEMLIPDAVDWERIHVSNRIPLRDGSRIRTTANVLCEIETVETGRIRMNQLAEVYVRDASYVELVRGRIWCESPASPALQVAAPVSEQVAVFCCPKSTDFSQFQCEVKDDETSVSSYTVNTGYWSADSIDWNVQPWEKLSLDSNSQSTRKRSDEGERVWQLPLLVVQTADTDKRELDSLLSSVLATVGRTKTMHMNESRIRQLGPAGAIPLLTFVARLHDDKEVHLRRTAMRIAAETADESATKLVQQLVRDPDIEIAQLATSALKRIRLSVVTE